MVKLCMIMDVQMVSFSFYSLVVQCPKNNSKIYRQTSLSSAFDGEYPNSSIFHLSIVDIVVVDVSYRRSICSDRPPFIIAEQRTPSGANTEHHIVIGFRTHHHHRRRRRHRRRCRYHRYQVQEVSSYIDGHILLLLEPVPSSSL